MGKLVKSDNYKNPHEKSVINTSGPPAKNYDTIIVGGGLFGTMCALKLAENQKVLLLERNNRLFSEASFINQNRIHYGFHYPRSRITAYESLTALASFKERFGEHFNWFENYYGIYKDGSQTTPEKYLEFAEHLKTAYGVYSEEATYPENFVKKDMIPCLLKVDEPNVDMKAIRDQLLQEVQDCPNIELQLNAEAKSVEIGQEYTIKTPVGKFVAPNVVNASYGNLLWHGMKHSHRVEIQLLEMVEIQSDETIPGLTVMDGTEGFSILPLGKTSDRYWWSSVKYGVHARMEVGAHLKFRPSLHSNWEMMKTQGEMYCDFMDKLKYVKSHFTARVFLLNHVVDLTSARPNLISQLGKGFYQLLSGKLTTCVEVSNEVANLINDNVDSAPAALDSGKFSGRYKKIAV